MVVGPEARAYYRGRSMIHPHRTRHVVRRSDRGRHATITVAAALLLLLGATGCDQDLLEGGMAVDNRTDRDLTIYALVEMPDDTVERSTLGTVAAGQSMSLSQSGYSPTGLRAGTDDGTVVATLPPRDPAVDECDFRWVIMEDDSWTEPL